ncbi:fumarylacetoacetate hydrolase family protein [Siccirubricoccus sp. KC 17139]|uniref:Fumarylacetoacetate hydrolase family protein n=1 Tax=Siccirubricoccus soli TaxID=2899147 RepID=A0ABT1D524_9PROT|nr:fumarylacetoacetate hydrolase family protein [Siccirubricoccus soli]MCO6417037.1 fumarylacetoacetate hydrolase family protein [Siccirubricoccus soli]MCP2683172.1 fumarylacetoacetate hydrolase family protein [Siccirubricoccus soli]
MKLITFEADGTTRIGAVLGEAVVALQPALEAACAAAGEAPQRLPDDMRGLLEAGEAGLVAAARALAFAARPESVTLRRPLSAVTLLAPLQPGKILGVGRNYADHAKEVGGPKLEAPRIFLKPTSSVCGPGSIVTIPKAALKPDWEVELGVVIGRPARHVPEGTALDYVAGYTVLNDLTDRALQFDHPIGMTSFGKGLDGFCPMGPYLTTADEVGEPWQLGLRCFLNGEKVQEGNTHDLIFSVAALVAWLSRFVTLQPGDVIATGTPAGVGHFRSPPRYLKPGDKLRLEVDRVGVLEHGIGGEA